MVFHYTEKMATTSIFCGWHFFSFPALCFRGESGSETVLDGSNNFLKSQIRTLLKRRQGCKTKNTALDSSLLILQCGTASNVLTQ